MNSGPATANQVRDGEKLETKVTANRKHLKKYLFAQPL
jgi:hypothetical protein